MTLHNSPPSLPPHNQPDDPVDPKPKIEAACHKSCLKESSEIVKCEARIKAKGEGNCEPWTFDYIKCIDACVSALFTLLCRPHKGPLF